jgi:hypothetical protein
MLPISCSLFFFEFLDISFYYKCDPTSSQSSRNRSGEEEGESHAATVQKRGAVTSGGAKKSF